MKMKMKMKMKRKQKGNKNIFRLASLYAVITLMPW